MTHNLVLNYGMLDHMQIYVSGGACAAVGQYSWGSVDVVPSR
jgi:hypothetical protein